MRLVHALKPFPFCITTRAYDNSHVEGDGLHPFRLTKDELFEWFWRARLWHVTLGYDHATVPISEETAYLEGFNVDENEKRRICKPYGIESTTNGNAAPYENVQLDWRFYGPGTPFRLFPDATSDAKMDLSGEPSVIREVDGFGVTTYRPLIAFGCRFFVGGVVDTFFSSSEQLIDECIAATAGFVKEERTGTFMGRTWPIFGMANSGGTPADEDWNIEVEINPTGDGWFPFAKANGTDPIYSSLTGALLSGKSPGDHLDPRE